MAFLDLVPFCLADKYFFDSPSQIPDDGLHFDESAYRPPDWTRRTNGLYISLRPINVVLPTQGWKIHISTVPQEAIQLIRIVCAYCYSNNLSFKFARSCRAVAIINSKYWNRSQSGKIIAIYPVNIEQFSIAVRELGDILQSFSGPYVLTDVRYRSGPVFARYGGFTPIWHAERDGTRSLAIRAPDGRLVPDQRDPIFTLPDFVEVPAILAPYIKRESGTLDKLAYQFERPLHFSNSGGVYLGRRKHADTPVVIREARPHAGLDNLGRDARSRLSNEANTLRRLKGIECVPQIIDTFKCWEHDFLVEEFISGNSLMNEIIARYPLVQLNPTKETLEAYVMWASRTFTDIENAIQAIRARGIVIGDLHPSNILVRPDGRIAIVDFECAGTLADEPKTALAAPGFSPPSGLAAEEYDAYAANCVRLMTLIPLVPILALAPEKKATLIRIATDTLPISSTTRQSIMDVLGVTETDIMVADSAFQCFDGANFDWATVSKSIVQGILESATPNRTDRLFPGDPLQFTHGSGALAYGAAGILLALKRVVGVVPDALVNWLARDAFCGEAQYGIGFYEGQNGIAYVLDACGEHDAALKLLRRASDNLTSLPLNLFCGQAGVALNMLHFAKRFDESFFHDIAVGIARRMLQLLKSDRNILVDGRPGLFFGATGAALLFLRLYEQEKHEEYLDAAESALRADLSYGSYVGNGTFQIRDGSRYLVYLDGGSAGIGLILHQLLEHRYVEDLAHIMQGICNGCRIPFVLQSGLFQGRSGLISVLSSASSSGVDPAQVREQISRLGWHAIPYKNFISFPGRGLLRLSSDLATGSAGVLLALQGALEGRKLALPFI